MKKKSFRKKKPIGEKKTYRKQKPTGKKTI